MRPVRPNHANAELITLIAKHFKVPKSVVEITAGSTGRRKRVRIDT